MSKVVGVALLLLGLQVGPGASRSAEANCVLTSVGGVKCWGGNLGDGTLNVSSTPVDHGQSGATSKPCEASTPKLPK